MKINITKRIENAFNRYNDTIALLYDFQKSKKNYHEFILLICARLDALANAIYNEKSQKENFCNFIVNYSTYNKYLTKVSIPDLFEYFSRQLWILPGTIEKPGRIYLFDSKEDRKFIKFIWDSGLAITFDQLSMLIKLLLKLLQAKYHVKLGQPKNKPYIDSINNIITYLLNNIQTPKRKKYEKAINSISPILKEFTLCSLLYKFYRCGIIHEYGFDIDATDFYRKKDPYWSPFYNDILETSHLRIQFPSKFLLNLLTKSIDNYKSHLKHTKLLPWEIWFELCDPLKEGKYLDDNTIPNGKDIKISI